MSSGQRGFSVAWVLAGVAALASLAVLGSQVFTTIVAGNQRSSLTSASSQILTQAAYTVTTELGYTAAGLPVAAAYLAAMPAPAGGGQLPVASAAPHQDAWGTALGYCTASAAVQGDPVFAVVSAGPDKMFATTCAQALVGTVAGDDGVRFKNVANVKQGVGGTVYFGDPVATADDLGNLALVKPGEMRVVRQNGSVWVNATGTVGQSYWTQASAGGGFGSVASGLAGDGCAGEGGLAKDNSTGELLVCEETSRVGFPDETCGTAVGRMSVDSARRIYVCG